MNLMRRLRLLVRWAETREGPMPSEEVGYWHEFQREELEVACRFFAIQLRNLPYAHSFTDDRPQIEEMERLRRGLGNSLRSVAKVLSTHGRETDPLFRPEMEELVLDAPDPVRVLALDALEKLWGTRASELCAFLALNELAKVRISDWPETLASEAALRAGVRLQRVVECATMSDSASVLSRLVGAIVDSGIADFDRLAMRMRELDPDAFSVVPSQGSYKGSYKILKLVTHRIAGGASDLAKHGDWVLLQTAGTEYDADRAEEDDVYIDRVACMATESYIEEALARLGTSVGRDVATLALLWRVGAASESARSGLSREGLDSIRARLRSESLSEDRITAQLAGLACVIGAINKSDLCQFAAAGAVGKRLYACRLYRRVFGGPDPLYMDIDIEDILAVSRRETRRHGAEVKRLESVKIGLHVSALLRGWGSEGLADWLAGEGAGLNIPQALVDIGVKPSAIRLVAELGPERRGEPYDCACPEVGEVCESWEVVGDDIEAAAQLCCGSMEDVSEC